MAGLARVLEPVLAAEVADVLGVSSPTRARLERSPAPGDGDLRIDLRRVLPGWEVETGLCEAVAERLGALEGFERAVAAPPRVYVYLDPAFLTRWVTDEVLGLGPRYGDAETARRKLLVLSYCSHPSPDPGAAPGQPLGLGALRNHVLGVAAANLFEARGWAVERHPRPPVPGEGALPEAVAAEVHGLARAGCDRAVFLVEEGSPEGSLASLLVGEFLGRGHAWARRVRIVGHGPVTLPPDGPPGDDAVSAASVLEAVAARFAARWPSHVGWGEAERARACERLAAGLLTYALLRPDRAQPCPFDEERLWRHGWPRFAVVLRALAWCEEAAAEGSGGDGGHVEDSREAEHAMALLLDRFPETLASAAERLDPALLVRLLDELASVAERAWRGEGTLGPRLPEAAGVVIRRALALLGVEVPDGLAALTPEPVPRPAGTVVSRTPVKGVS